MKNKILFLFFSFIFVICYSQNNPKKYYEYINKAELAICDFKYEKASQYYKKAFKAHTPFINDLVNATTLNVKFTKNYNLSLNYALILLQRDFEIGWIYRDIPPEDSLIAMQLKILEDTVTSLTDKNLISILEQMVIEDQMYRTNQLEKERNYQIDSINYYKLFELFNVKDLVTEKNAGSFSQFKIILIHTSQQHMNPKILLIKNVMDGEFPIKQYMKIFDLYCENISEPSLYGTGWSDVYISNGILFINYPKNISHFNEERKKINMSETWEDYLKKVKYQFLYGNFQFYTRVEGYFEENVVEKHIQEIDQEHQNGIFKREYIRKDFK
jgi:hypothetical protein